MDARKMEAAALGHAAEWLLYSRSPQYARDMATEKASRAARDKANGHTPECTLARCSARCASALAAQVAK